MSICDHDYQSTDNEAILECRKCGSERFRLETIDKNPGGILYPLAIASAYVFITLEAAFVLYLVL